jgi:hypothetical protein
MVLSIKLFFAVIGLILPGHATARLLGLRLSWAVAFPFSALLLTGFVITYSLLGAPIRLNTIAPALCGITILCYWISRDKIRDPLDDIQEVTEITSKTIKASVFVLSSLIVTIVAIRTTLYPLSGFDTYFRWEALARAMLSQESLHYYPPVTAENFNIYLFTDGIPPLVSTVYWWLYAVMGKPVEQVTSISVVLQFISTMILTFYATRYNFNTRAGYFALVVFATSTMLIDGFAIGQETGLLTLSMAGQICFSLAAVRNPKASLVVATALFAVLASLSRDYGPALALTGFSILAWNPVARRFLPLFTVTTVVLSLPWYLRNWYITGNPLYSHRFFGLQTNSIHTAIMDSYTEIFSFSQIDSSQWLSIAIILFCGAPLAILFGIPLLIARWRDSTPIIAIVCLVIFLWVLSVAQTAGGLVYSMRVFTPALVALTMFAGAAFSDYYFEYTRNRGIIFRVSSSTILVLTICYALIYAASHPLNPKELFTALTSRHAGLPQFCSDLQELTDELNASDLPPTGLLTDDNYLATLIQRNTRFRPVMVWSPEVRFVFDKKIDSNEVRKRLITQNIRLISYGKGANELFFSRIRFYKEDMPYWKQMITKPESTAIFLLPRAQ